MITRSLTEPLLDSLREVPAVCLLGPCQSGNTTMAFELAKEVPSLYLDLESQQDRARLVEPEDYLTRHLDTLVILDEVHRAPNLFPLLRGLIDRARREGRETGLYLLLGSAALALLKQSGESLAGRVRYLELTPFTAQEPTGGLWCIPGRTVFHSGRG